MCLSMQLHVKYLRSLEDSDRVRTACLAYLRNWLINIYPERRDLVERLERVAAELGGRLESPQLSWKYAWIKSLFGWEAAKRSLLVLPALKASYLRSWDRTMHNLRVVHRPMRSRLNS